MIESGECVLFFLTLVLRSDNSIGYFIYNIQLFKIVQITIVFCYNGLGIISGNTKPTTVNTLESSYILLNLTALIRRDSMNFQSIHYFITLAREKNFTHAAEKLHITQQTLSANMAAIEKEWGMKFFLRHIPLELTDAGKVFYEYALQFANQEKSLSRMLKDISNEEAGNLRIGIGFIRERHLMPKLVADFRQLYPKVTFSLVEGSNVSLLEKVRQGDIDLTIAHFQEEPPGIEVTPIYKEQICFLVSKELLQRATHCEEADIQKLQETHLQDMDILAHCPFITTGAYNVAGYVEAKYLAAASFEPQVVVTSDNMGTLIDMCLLGVGALFAPANLIHHTLLEKYRQDMIQINLPETAYEISFGHRRKSPGWSIRDRFMDFVIQSMKRK